jgi:hypothetical protein
MSEVTIFGTIHARNQTNSHVSREKTCAPPVLSFFFQQSSSKLTEITTLASDPSTTSEQLFDDPGLLHALQYESESVENFFARTGNITRLLEWSLTDLLFQERNTDHSAGASPAVLCCNCRDITREVLDFDLDAPGLMQF